MSITDIKEVIKSVQNGRNKDFVVLAIIVLSATGSFALGRLSALESEEILITQTATVKEAFSRGSGDSEELVGNEEVESEGLGQISEAVVASKSGSKYHFPWCAGARSIKEGNKITFESTAAARAAGYTPAANCKGLK